MREPELFAAFCSGSTSANRNWSANSRQPEFAKYPAAFWLRPCSRTTAGAPAGGPAGR
ncbi:hypothetical protein [Actinoplanes sp. ATCC 53533]|uniref:hypothetical protein n=1 Tax=Actinoplanes sp. ATCC 53533 TaxID=1288362 RepID=UPI0013150E05|nr:hypothetical protein [Actinoplanes sp. ATCC 53533]